jgi:EF hand
MAYFGVDMDIRIQEICLNFKNQIRNRGGIGIISLGRIFREMDTNGNHRLDAEEFEQALATFG